ncbi:MAG: MerR family transcriptional regulator [Rhodococcus sp.]|nr:MerR family transcriptional regulator [Rhodococcus sp. (in: high G+C Gram-positive bacteria)]
MRVSELVARSGVPLATVKYYLREGLLMPGEATSATQATYGDEHLDRLALIKALSNAGLAIPRIRTILRLIEKPDDSRFELLGKVIAQLPPYVSDAEDGEHQDYPRARRVLEQLGQIYDPRFVAVAQLERALEAAEAAGIPMDDERVAAYGEHIRGIAETDIRMMPTGAAAGQAQYAVLGTILYEPIIAALRRLAHQDLTAKLLLLKTENPDRQDPP